MADHPSEWSAERMEGKWGAEWGGGNATGYETTHFTLFETKALLIYYEVQAQHPPSAGIRFLFGNQLLFFLCS